MTIEPTNAFTVCTPAVLPPKPDPKPLAPRFTPAEDAARIRARYRKTWGETRDGGPGLSANEKRMIEARERRERFAAQILALLADSPLLPTRKIEKIINLSHEQTRTILAAMRKEGTVIMRKNANGHSLWVLA